MRPAAPSQNAGYSQGEGRKETEACDVKSSRGDSGEKLRCAEDFQPSQQQSCDPSSHPTSGRASNLWRVRLRRMENFRHFCCWRREPVYCPEGKGSARQRWDFLAPCDLSRGFWQPTPAAARPPLPLSWPVPSVAHRPGRAVGCSLDSEWPAQTLCLSLVVPSPSWWELHREIWHPTGSR